MIYYNSRDISNKTPYGAVEAGAPVSFCVSVQEDGCLEVNLVMAKEGCDPETVIGARDGSKFTFEWRSKFAGLYFYYFQARYEWNRDERTDSCQLTVFEREDDGPAWLSSGVMYQIFPDRFAKSDKYQAPFQIKNHKVHDRWGELPVHAPDENGVTLNNDFFGGNLAGILDRLDYLEDMGVTVIYLNPVFEAFSNHRYDTGDYHKIDPMLGTEKDFSELCCEASKRGIRVVIDGVYNHTGADSLYFNKYANYKSVGACQGEDSPYFNWYSFIFFPDVYESWWGIDTLPAVNEKADSYLDFIIRGEDSVIRHWLRAGASGVRLDVVDELPDVFLDELRVAVKEEKKDAMIIGEVWEDASNKEAYGERRRYFQGKQLDSVMNYPLKDAIIRYLGYDHNAKWFSDTIEGLRENYPAHTFNSLMNILGTHDTKRILTVFMESSWTYDEARQKLYSALLIWALMPGIPCIYYGDEIGMQGDKDPMNRQCFCPDRKNGEISAYFRRLLNFRKSIKDIDKMEYVPGEPDGGHFSFKREGNVCCLHVSINDQGENRRISFPGADILDFVISGRVDYVGDKTFEMYGKSGIAVLTSR
ncbi:MAG: glycoside hydrolase family 13 protein [Clostridiales bacterium]|nr:glycoside hydrolase family 13 protein [Clostridiales bacterium]